LKKRRYVGPANPLSSITYLGYRIARTGRSADLIFKSRNVIG